MISEKIRITAVRIFFPPDHLIVCSCGNSYYYFGTLADNAADVECPAADLLYALSHIPQPDMRLVGFQSFFHIEALAVVLYDDLMPVIDSASGHSDQTFFAYADSVAYRVFHHWLNSQRRQLEILVLNIKFEPYVRKAYHLDIGIDLRVFELLLERNEHIGVERVYVAAQINTELLNRVRCKLRVRGTQRLYGRQSIEQKVRLYLRHHDLYALFGFKIALVLRHELQMKPYIEEHAAAHNNDRKDIYNVIIENEGIRKRSRRYKRHYEKREKREPFLSAFCLFVKYIRTVR